MISLQQAIDRIRAKQDLTQNEAAETATEILEGKHSDNEIAEFLVSLSTKGETGDEIAGFASVLIQNAVHVDAPAGTVDLCGTGGSGRARFNVSTAAAFVVSACGVPVAKHGNRGSRQPNGSFDFLEALDLPLELPAQNASLSLESVGIAFLYARQYHPIMKNVVNARKIAARRTIFNLVGPLSNPANVDYQVIGTCDPGLMQPLGEALQGIGRRRSIVVYGEPGIDEISISGETRLLKIDSNTMSSFSVSPTDFGIAHVPYDALPSGDAESNVSTFNDVLEGKIRDGIVDMISVNAAAAMYIAGHSSSLIEGYGEAHECILDGRMKAKYEAYRSYVRSVDA